MPRKEWNKATKPKPATATPPAAAAAAESTDARALTARTSLHAQAQEPQPRQAPRSSGGTFLPREGEQAWMQPYLDALIANCGQVVAACKTAGVSRVTVAKYRNTDPVFEEAEVKARTMAVETAESEATRRAVDGVKSVERRTWVDSSGRKHSIVRVETKYSDAILLRLLERQETGTWRQKQQIEHSGGLTFKTRAQRKEALERARAALNQPVTAINGRS